MTNPNELFSIKRTCAELRIHRDTLRKYTNKGLIQPTANVLGQCCYARAEVERFYNALNYKSND